MFFIEDIKSAYLMEDGDGEDVIEKYGRPLGGTGGLWVVSFDGMQALVSLAMYGFGGEQKYLRRYQEIMAE